MVSGVTRRLAVVVAVVVLVAAAAAGAAWWTLGRGPTGPLADAMRTLPADSLRLGFTDWSRVTRELDAPRGEAALDPDDLGAFLTRAYDADVTTTSAVVESFAGLYANFGITPADAEWEAYGQARTGSVEVLRLREGTDLDRIEDGLREAGYEEPDDPDGIWVGSGELVATLDEPLTYVQENIALLRDRRLMVMAEETAFLEKSLPTVLGDEDSVWEADGVPELVAAAGGATSAQLWVGDFVCEDLSMGTADPRETSEGERMVEEAGGVHPLDGMVLSRVLDGPATVGLWFASEDQAADDLQPRTDLARGPAPGQGGTFGERFEVTRATQDGRLVELSLEPRVPTVMSDLGQGAVLFATC